MPTCVLCNNVKTRLNRNNACNECRNNGTSVNESNNNQEELHANTNVPELPIDWMTKPLSELLGGHLVQLINKNVNHLTSQLNEQKKRINTLEKCNKELKDSCKTVKDENAQLSIKLSAAESKIMRLEKNEATIKTILTKQQIYLAKEDKSKRVKNILISGLSEKDDLKHNQLIAHTDIEKVNLLLDIMNKSDIKIARCRRVGTEDQGHEGRGRFLLVEFFSTNERNEVKNNAYKLNELGLNNIRLKADLTKEERNEYKRLYTARDVLAESNPDSNVRVDKGKLYLEDNIVDQIKISSKIFE